MCGIWTQKQWQAAANKPGSRYSVVGRFQSEGQTVLQIKEAYPDTSYYWNIYSEDGKDHTVHYSQERAIGAMGRRGFHPETQTATAEGGDLPETVLA